MEEHELSQEEELDRLRDELQLIKDINSSQEQTILDLQQQVAESGSTETQKKLTAKVLSYLLLLVIIIVNKETY